MIGMALYVDNLERVKYDIPVIVENWKPLADKIFLFSGGSSSTSILKSKFVEDKHLEIIELGVKIRTPKDIPVATDTSIRYCYDNGVDALVFCYADIYATPNCIELLSKSIQKREALNIIFEHVQLYQRMWAVYGGMTLQYKENPIFCTPGTGHFAVIKGNPLQPNCTLVKDETLLLEMGYLTISQYRTKMYSHNFLWPDKYKVDVTRAFDNNVKDGLTMAYKMIKTYKKQGLLVPIDQELYRHLFDIYNVWDEYNYCVGIMKGISS